MLSLTTILILGLASYRAVQLIVWDTIGDPLRARLELWHAAKFESGVRTFVRNLIGCPYCTGWWVSMITTLVYLTATGGWGSAPLLVHAVECWAVTGVQALANRWDDSRPGHNPKS